MLKSIWRYGPHTVETYVRAKDDVLRLIREEIPGQDPQLERHSHLVHFVGYRHTDNMVRACPEAPDHYALFDVGTEADQSFITVPVWRPPSTKIKIRQGSSGRGLFAKRENTRFRQRRIWFGLEYVPDETMAWSDWLRAWVNLGVLAPLEREGWPRDQWE